RRRKRYERIDHVQKAIYTLRKTISRVHPCESLIEYGVFRGEIEAYRLTASSACALSPGFH
ncbi:MAG TPA: hypothetical protein VEP90_29300, partial [Methylomirabilota bacterium]|nr:hypothetical protein [Methylomirabilota bacterium]